MFTQVRYEKDLVWFERFSIFLVYVWFGLLKVVWESPANPLVDALLQRTMPFITFGMFIFWFGLFEVIIGVFFLIPKWERLAAGLLTVHLITTLMPLFLLPAATWTGVGVPTLEGQYIIKNVLIMAVAARILYATRRQRASA